MDEQCSFVLVVQINLFAGFTQECRSHHNVGVISVASSQLDGSWFESRPFVLFPLWLCFSPKTNLPTGVKGSTPLARLERAHHSLTLLYDPLDSLQ